MTQFLSLIIQDPLFYILAVPSILLFGISKGGFGGGLGILTIPILSIVLPVEQAAGIVLPILCVMDLVGIAKFQKKWDKTNLKKLIPSSILGILIGYFAFGLLSPKSIKILIGILAILFSLNFFIRKKQQANKFQHSFWKSAFWGSLGGFTSFVAHAGGPPINIYLLPQKLEKTIFSGTTILLFAIINYIKLIPYYFLGQLKVENLATSLVLMPLAPIGILMGYYLHQKIPTELFYKVCYFCLFITGIKLIF